MKRILALALFALSSVTFAATLNPIQLLNPVGSTSGQVISSTGSSSAPTWATVVPASGGAFTGSVSISTANPIFSLLDTAQTGGIGRYRFLNSGGTLFLQRNTATAGDFSTSTFPLTFPPTDIVAFRVRPTFNSATPWDSANLASPAATTGNLSQFAATTSAQLATVVSDETGSGVLVFGTSPTIATPNVTGVTNGSDAAAGSLGETGSAATGSGVSLTSASPANCASKSLTAGNYLVIGAIIFNGGATTSTSAYQAGISTTSATLPSVPNVGQFFVGTSGTNTAVSVAVPSQILKLTTTTTVFLVGQATFATSTEIMSCSLQSIRIH